MVIPTSYNVQHSFNYSNMCAHCCRIDIFMTRVVEDRKSLLRSQDGNMISAYRFMGNPFNYGIYTGDSACNLRAWRSFLSSPLQNVLYRLISVAGAFDESRAKKPHLTVESLIELILYHHIYLLASDVHEFDMSGSVIE